MDQKQFWPLLTTAADNRTGSLRAPLILFIMNDIQNLTIKEIADVIQCFHGNVSVLPEAVQGSLGKAVIVNELISGKAFGL